MRKDQNASAIDYLTRLQDQNTLLHDDLVLHAVWADRLGNLALITSQPDYHGTEPALNPRASARTRARA
ncbi:MAG: hypothetical protein JNJ83_24300 [Verrucomicrobiaceae bacterium]|nr:hypothetical protein [Verrucomicrobiaceae bacterium]